MPDATYRPDTAELARLLRSQAIENAMVRAGHTVADRARASAPARTGDYRSKFTVEGSLVPTLTRGGTQMRAGAVVKNTARSAPAVEGRTHVLARAAGRTNFTRRGLK